MRHSTNSDSLAARIPTYLGKTWHDLRQISKFATELARNRWQSIGVALFLVLLAAFALRPYETALLHAIQSIANPQYQSVAKQLSFWGDYQTGTLILSFTLWLAGFFSRRSYLRNAAIACLIAASAAGLFTDLFRYGLGRARPNAGVADGFYGPSLKSKFHGFPSGHTTTAFGTAIPIAVMFPSVAIPSVAVAASVGWSRMYLNYHRPTDVLVGAGIGISFGLVIGVAARRLYAGEEKAD